LADLLTDFPERFDRQPSVWLAPAGFAGDPLADAALARPAEVASHWLPTGRNAGRIVLQLAGIDTIEQAQALAGCEVLVPIAERLPLADGAAYISDLVGCTVFDRDRAIGRVDAVHFPTSPDGSRRLDEAAPLLSVLTPEGEEVLVPFVRAFLAQLDTTAKTIRMTLPEGLVEINQSRPSLNT
jgi:16S rRNA processing protein RimM